MKYDDDSISEYDSDEDDDYGGFAIEFGELKIGDKNIQSNIDDSASTGTMNLPTPKGFIDPDAGTTPPETKGIKNIVKDLSGEFSKQLGEKPRNNPDNHDTSEMESDSSSIEDQRMDLELGSLQYNGSEDIPRTTQKTIFTNIYQDIGETLNVSQSNAPRSLGKNSLNLINSAVYAPSKQDGGGERS